MKIRTVWIAAGLVTAAFGRAQAFVPPIFPETKVLAQMLSYGLPTVPLARRSKEFKLVPTYFTYQATLTKEDRFNTGETNRLSGTGWGGALSFVYGLSPHWGLSLYGCGLSQNGSVNYTAGSSALGYHGAGSGSFPSNGFALYAAAVFDPFSDPKGFRLPILAGLSYLRIASNSTMGFQFIAPPPGQPNPNPNTPPGTTGTVDFSRTENSSALFAAVSPQMETGPVRWMPFALVLRPNTAIDDKVDMTTNRGQRVQIRKTRAIDPIIGVGMAVGYMPWGLSFTYMPPLKIGANDQIESSVYTMKWTKKWRATSGYSRGNRRR